MIGEEVNTVISNLCQQFGESWEVIAPELIVMYTRRYAVFTTIAMLATICCALVCLVSWKKAKEDCDWYFPFAIFGIVGVLTAMIFLDSVLELVEWIANPNTKAIEYVLEMVRGR